MSPRQKDTGRRSDGLFASLRKFSRLWGFAAFLLFTIVLFRQVVVPFIFAFALAYILQPIIKRMEGTIGRVSSVIVVYVGVLGAIAAFIMLFLPALIEDFTRLRDAAPKMIEYADQELLPRATQWLSESFGSLEPEAAPEVAAGAGDAAKAATDAAVAKGPASQVVARPLPDGSWQLDLEGVHLQADETGSGHWTIVGPQHEAASSGLEDTLRKLVQTKGAEYTGMIYEVLRSLIGGISSFLTKFVITLMLAAFILIDPQRIWNFVRSLIPQIYREDFDTITKEMDTGLSGVIRGQLLICLVNGVLTYIGLVLIGIKYSFLLGVIAGAFSLIPIFGTIISSIPIMVVGLVSTDDGSISLGPPLLMLAWISGIHLLEANVLNPKIIGDAAHMHPIIVVFALLAGEQVFGLTGALLAVPAASIVQTLFIYALRTSALRRQVDPSLSMVASQPDLGGLSMSAEVAESVDKPEDETSA